METRWFAAATVRVFRFIAEPPRRRKVPGRHNDLIQVFFRVRSSGRWSLRAALADGCAQRPASIRRVGFTVFCQNRGDLFFRRSSLSAAAFSVQQTVIALGCGRTSRQLALQTSSLPLTFNRQRLGVRRGKVSAPAQISSGEFPLDQRHSLHEGQALRPLASGSADLRQPQWHVCLRCPSGWQRRV